MPSHQHDRDQTFLATVLGGEWHYDAVEDSYRREPAFGSSQWKAVAACLDNPEDAQRPLTADEVAALQALGAERQLMLTIMLGGLTIAETCEALGDILGGQWQPRDNGEAYYAHLFNTKPIIDALTKQDIPFTYQGYNSNGTLEIDAEIAGRLIEHCQQSWAMSTEFGAAKTISESWQR